MLGPEDRIIAVDYDDEIETVVVRTDRETDFEDKLKKKTLTSGCAQGTVFGDLMEKFDEVRLDPDAVLRTSWLYALTRKINTAPSLYLAAGAIHGCVLCEEDRPLLYMEDVGRHNAVDKIAGYMHLNGISPAGKIFYTTGRLTSEMVIKTVQMGIPILISRSGFTAWGVELARQAGLTLIGRAKGRRFVALAGAERIVFDGDPHERRRRAGAARPQGQPGRKRTPRREHRRALARRRAVAPHGRRRQGAAAARRADPPRPCHRSRAAAGRRAGAQRQWRPGALRPLWPAGRRRQHCRFRRARSPASSPGSIGPPPTGPIARSSPASPPTRRFCPPTSWRGWSQGMEAQAADLACAASGGQPHPVIGLWPVRLREDLRQALVDEGIRKVDVWTARYRLATVRFPDRPESIRSSTPTGPRTSTARRRCCRNCDVHERACRHDATRRSARRRAARRAAVP